MHLSALDPKQVKNRHFLNDKRSIYLSQITTGSQKDKQKSFIFKCHREDQIQRIRKLHGNTHPLVIKPACFVAFNRQIHTAWEVQSMSLQTILFLHRLKKTHIEKQLIRSFSKLFDTISKMHKGGLAHGNLKPSNIFVDFPDQTNMSPQEIEWKVSQAGLSTFSSCKFYSKPLINPSKSKSMFFDPFQNDCYSLGIIFLQMVTLKPIQKIYQTLNERGVDALIGHDNREQQSPHLNNSHLINFIRVLLNPKQLANLPGRNKNINSVFHNYQDSVNIDKRISFQIDYKNFYFSEEIFNKAISNQKIDKMIKNLQDKIKKNELNCKDILGYIKRQIDPDQQFIFPTSLELKRLLNEYLQLDFSDDDILLFGFYFLSQSQINYMNVLLKVIKKSQIAQNIIQKCVQRYNSSREFFQDQSKSKDFWKAEDAYNFFNIIKVPFSLDDVKEIFRQWTKNQKATSIKLDEFRKLFKTQNQSTFMTKSSKKIDDNKSKDKLIYMLQQLQSVKNNLVHFFRLNDIKGKWSVPMSSIKQQIKKYIKPRKKQQQKQIFEEMFDMARVSQTSKQIDYIVLLKKTKLFQPIELFRLILVEKINEQGKQEFYKKYEKDQKGWTITSLIDFCSNQYLEFDEREQRQFFNTLDKDDSGYINLKQLLYKLTGIQQFDIEFIVQTIKNKINNNGQKVFDCFLKVDSNARLLLNNLQDLKQVFHYLGLQIQPSHYQQLYQKFSRKGKFQYLSFLRYFCTLDQIFLKSCKIIIEEQYGGNFDKFFKLGLKGQKKKWTRQSLTMINDNLILGYRDRELDQLWNIIDKNQQHSLTKQQIGSIFQKQVQKLEEFKSRAVQSLQDVKPKRQYADDRKNYDSRNYDNKPTQRSIKNTSQQNVLQKNQLIKQLKQQNILNLLANCYKKSSSNCSVWVQTQVFSNILNERRINFSKKYIEKNFPHYVEKRQSNNICLNYLKFFLLVSQFKYDPPKQKTQCIKWMLQTFCKQKRLRNNDLFSMCRRSDRMRLTDFQNILKKVVDQDIFFQDINDVWQFWGKPEYLTLDDYQYVLNESDPRALNKRMSFGAQKDRNSPTQSIQPQTPYLRSKQQSARDRKRKQSRDSVQLNKFALPQKYKQQQDKYYRNERKRSNDRIQQRQNYKKYDQKRNMKFPPKEDRKTSMQNQLYDRKHRRQGLNDNSYQRNDDRKQRKDKSYEKNTQTSKKDLINKFQDKIQQRSMDPLTNLFMDTNRIDAQIFTECLMKNYQFSKRQAQQISEHLGTFGKIKIQTIKKYLKSTSPKKKQKNNERQQPSRYKKEKQRTVQFSNKTPEKFQSDKMIAPVTRQIKPQKKLVNQGKKKLNTPLIKQQIKLILKGFSQRFAIQEIDRYFFDDSDSIERDQFIKKCHQITPSLNQQAIQKIFDFLKPNQKDQVSILSFKIAFSYDQNIQVQPQYLPKELQKQLQQIFNKHDRDKSGSIEPSQVQALLSTLGFNQTQKEIQNIFMKIDKNFDNQISFQEFKQFIEQFILPHLIDFEDDVDELFKMLKMNDVFNTGCVTTPVLIAVIQRFGVKITNQEAVYIAKYIGNQNQQIPIYDFLGSLYYPSNPVFPPIVKSALYKIKLRKRVSLKQIQKIFQNISSNFVIAYTSRIIKNQMLKRSTAFQPLLHESYLFYQDFYYKDFKRIQAFKNDKVLVDQENKTNTILVEIKIMQAYGVPIPQNQNIKSNILKRAMNITFFDMSAQSAKYCITTLQADWDSEVQDQWIFDKNNRSVFLKIANYDAKKFEKVLILFELIITINDNGKPLDVSCGSTSISIKQLVSVQSRFNKKLKLTSGIPTKSKEIDKVSVTKRSGWKTFLGSSNQQSELQIQIHHQSRFKDKSALLYALPAICLVKRKALHYVWTFRQYFAERCVDKDIINPQFSAHHTVRAFILSLDIDDISSQVINFWKQKVEQNIKQAWQARAVFYNFMTDLYMILHSKQFQLKLSNPCATTITNKSLFGVRQKMIRQVFDNIENYVKNDLPKGKAYHRLKNYSYNYSPIVFEYNRGSLQSYVNNINSGVKVGKN